MPDEIPPTFNTFRGQRLPDWAPDLSHLYGLHESERERPHDPVLQKLAYQYGLTHDGLIFEEMQEYLWDKYGVHINVFDWRAWEEAYAFEGPVPHWEGGQAEGQLPLW